MTVVARSSCHCATNASLSTRSISSTPLLRSLLAIALCFCIGLCLSVPVFPQQRNQKNQRNPPAGRGNSKRGSNADLEQRIDRLVQAKVREMNIPGYSLAVVYKGRTVLQKGYGFADREARVPVTPETVFGLASVTKTFTGLALLLLVDDGKVRVEDTLDKYYDGLSPAYRKLTIRQLASMTAGVPEKGVGDAEGLSWQQQIRKAQNRPLDSKPGSTYSYANLSFRILGGVIEKASGKSYMTFLKERVLDPLGMTQTGPSDQNFTPPIAAPYVNKGGQIKRVDGYKAPAINFAAGMLASNTIDLVKYAEGLLNHKLLSPAGYNLLWKSRPKLATGKPSTWAFGWGANTTGGHFRLAMQGGLPGVASSIQIFPDDRLIVVGLANVSGKDAKAYSIVQLVIKEVLGQDLEGGIEGSGSESAHAPASSQLSER